MFKGAKKEDLRLIASEINLTINEKMTIADLNDIIENSEMYENKPELVTEIANTIIESRKHEEQRQIELERVKLERSKNELELAKLRIETKSDLSESEIKPESLDQLIKSIRTLTVKIPIRPEGWGFFFSSLERAFNTKNVSEKDKAEILLNLLGDKSSNIITYLNDKDIANYEKIKELVLREFQPTPYSCLEHFRKTFKQPHETHVQFASRLVTSWDYYLKLRNVSDFETLKQLIVSDKLYQTLDKETASHISVRQGEKWFSPSELGREVDLYFTSRGKALNENFNGNRKYNSKNVTKVFLADVKSSKCVICNENHPLYKCPDYKKLSVDKRVELVKKHNFCFNCLALNHCVKNCKSKYSCSICGKRHHITLHFQTESHVLKSRNETYGGGLDLTPIPSLDPLAPEFTSGTVGNTSFTATSVNKSKNVLLSTVICFLNDEFGKLHPVKTLLDVGSTSSFLTSECANRLRLKTQRVNIVVSGLNDTLFTIRSRVIASICNENKSYERNLDLLVVPKITQDLIPSSKIDVNMHDFCNIKLADEKFNIPERIEMLLGAEVFYELLKPGQVRSENSSLILQNTVFGFVVSGSATQEKENRVHCGLIKTTDDLEKTMTKFWEIESVEEIIKNKETIICEEHYQKTHRRDETGKYIVTMPLKEDPSCLGESKEISMRKLNALWKRLSLDPDYLKLYREFLAEYEKLGHMYEVLEEEDKTGSYFIPHLGVYRPDSSSTKLRVVFNASSPTTKGNSLNSIQFNGGVIQDDIFALMVRFRKHIFAFTADVEKMFRMIWITSEQRKLQRILWKEEIEKPVRIYELATVTYGTVSAPYLAMRTLRQLALDEFENFPLAAPIVMSDVYMDDILSGSDTLSGAKEVQRQLSEIFKKGGMNLHKWFSNNNELNNCNELDYAFLRTEETKTLGVHWNPLKDHFSFKVVLEPVTVHTKRTVLSTIARIFDPLGLLGPIIAKAKIIMQKLWQLKINWNDPLPAETEREWQQFTSSLHLINEIKVERCIIVEEAATIELHGFADSSEKAYGAVIYAKSVKTNGEVKVKMIASKSRVAPLKSVTIPRLELCAAVLLSQLTTRCIAALSIDIEVINLYTDSTIVLAWLRKPAHLLKPFVSNRVATIQNLTKNFQWCHVRTVDNPADLISRGLDPSELLRSEIWWNCPFLMNSPVECCNNSQPEVDSEEYLQELKSPKENIMICSDTKIVPDNNSNILNDLLNCTNNYVKLIRILSFLFRFINNSRYTEKRTKGPLNNEEVSRAEIFILRLVQREEFEEDFTNLTNSKAVKGSSKLKWLYPFIDSDNLIRVGGRLQNSNRDFSQKHPIVLPSKHKLSRLISEYFHKKYLHVGPQSLLHLTRQKYWILNGSNLAKKTVRECVICFRNKPITAEQLMGNLPKERVTPGFPFNYTGVDFAGPFYIKYKGQRKGTLNKIYVSLFVCLATRAIHLEIVTDLTSESFIETLKRFIARRGKCSKLFTDNATNFVGAHNELKRLHKLVNHPDHILAKYFTSEAIEWQFIPPRSPNFGGLWEAGIKSVKHHLRRVMGNLKLTYEEFLTVIAQIEGILNSRPLTPLTSDVSDLEVLTPAHFLIGRPITALVEPELIKVPDNRLRRWQLMTKTTQQIWKHWSRDYLNHLQSRNKWYFSRENVKVGSLVLIKEENVPPAHWLLGRIQEVVCGPDQKIRVVKLKTKNGILTRAISKICLLPIEKDSNM